MGRIERSFDFCIICNQRSGSNLLASFLDSHPEVNCWMEVRGSMPKKPTVHRNGCIVMYNKRGQIRRIDPFYVIHLTRNPEDTALSACKNSILRRRHGKDHAAHRVRGKPWKSHECKPNLDHVRTRAQGIRGYQKGIRRSFLPSLEIPVLEVTYEEMTGGGDVEVMPEKLASTILGFLEVNTNITLTTHLQKAGI